MKKTLLFIALMFVCAGANAGQVQVFDRDYDSEMRLSSSGLLKNFSDSETAIYLPQDAECLTVYAVGGGTISEVTCTVNADSVTFTSTGGLYPGTTDFVFADTDKDTIGELITYMNNVSAITPGVGGGLVASLPQGSYDGNISSSIVAADAQSIFYSTAPVTLETEQVSGISYLIPAPTNGDSIYLTNAVVNATYGSGSLSFAVYDGTSTSSTQLRKETGGATTVDKSVNLPIDNFKGSANTAMRIDLVGTAAISSAYMNLTYKKRQ
jgi:hypothetical protein